MDTQNTPVNVDQNTDQVSALKKSVAAVAATLETIASTVAALQPAGSAMGTVASAVQDVSQVAGAEATGDAAKIATAETMVVSDIVARLVAYEKSHSADIVSMIHTLYTRVFGSL